MGQARRASTRRTRPHTRRQIRLRGGQAAYQVPRSADHLVVAVPGWCGHRPQVGEVSNLAGLGAVHPRDLNTLAGLPASVIAQWAMTLSTELGNAVHRRPPSISPTATRDTLSSVLHGGMWGQGEAWPAGQQNSQQTLPVPAAAADQGMGIRHSIDNRRNSPSGHITSDFPSICQARAAALFFSAGVFRSQQLTLNCPCRPVLPSA